MLNYKPRCEIILPKYFSQNLARMIMSAIPTTGLKCIKIGITGSTPRISEI